MSCDNFENICIFCQDIDVKNDDNSMNMIETSEHNQNEHNQHEQIRMNIIRMNIIRMNIIRMNIIRMN